MVEREGFGGELSKKKTWKGRLGTDRKVKHRYDKALKGHLWTSGGWKRFWRAICGRIRMEKEPTHLSVSTQGRKSFPKIDGQLKGK